MRCLILIGYRATGKTSLARLLGERLHLAAVDTDVVIEQRAGKTIAEIFAQDGEPVFRDCESQVIAELLRGETMIVATGGGLPLREENRELLKQHGHVVWLKASPETIHRRMSGDPGTEDTRPQLTTLPPLEEISHLLEKRRPIYAEIADLELDTETATLPELANQIAEWYQRL